MLSKMSLGSPTGYFYEDIVDSQDFPDDTYMEKGFKHKKYYVQIDGSEIIEVIHKRFVPYEEKVALAVNEMGGIFNKDVIAETHELIERQASIPQTQPTTVAMAAIYRIVGREVFYENFDEIKKVINNYRDKYGGGKGKLNLGKKLFTNLEKYSKEWFK